MAWQELSRVPVGKLGIFEEGSYLDNCRLLRGEKISVVPCGGLVGVVLTGPFEIRKNLLVERVDWNLGDVDVGTGFLFPPRRVIFDTVADCRPEYHHVDRRVLVWLGLEIIDALPSNWGLIGRHG